MTYDEIKETLAGFHGERAKKDMEDFLNEDTLRGNARDYKVTTVKGNPWDCNVSIPDDTPSEMDAWLRSIGY